MKLAKLVRGISSAQGTAGMLTFGTCAIRTLELPWRDNIKQISCIPLGTYRAIWARSPKMGMCYHLLAVPSRSCVLIHPANFAGEEPFDTQLHGCIAPCSRIGVMRNTKGVMQLAGLVSRPATNLFNAWGETAPIELEITS